MQTCEIIVYAVAAEAVGDYESYMDSREPGLALSSDAMGREELAEFVKSELATRCPNALAAVGAESAGELVYAAVNAFSYRDW